jgi:hypothetical protein
MKGLFHSLSLSIALAACTRGPEGSPFADAGRAGNDLAPTDAAAAAATQVSAPQAPSAWHGSYKSQAGTLYIPPDWKGVRWNVAESTAGLGEGLMRVTLDPTGRVQGRVEGPLGPALIAGVVADGDLTASLRPEKPDDRSFAGTLTGRITDKGIEGTMHASAALADAIRVASFVLGVDGAPAR